MANELWEEQLIQTEITEDTVNRQEQLNILRYDYGIQLTPHQKKIFKFNLNSFYHFSRFYRTLPKTGHIKRHEFVA